MNWLASLHSQCLHFQSMARSWLCRGWPFSRPSFAVTSASTTSVATSRTASWATCCMWHWTCCRIVFRSSSCSFPWLNCILIGLKTPCDTCVFFTLPHGASLQTPFSSFLATLRDRYGTRQSTLHQVLENKESTAR